MREISETKSSIHRRSLRDALIEQLDLSTQDMGLQLHFVITTTPCIPLSSLHSPNLRSHSDGEAPLDEFAPSAPVSRLGQGRVAPDESHNDS